MKRENLIGYMADPASLNQSTLPEIEELAKTFPYFQTAHLLLVRNHHNLDSVRFHDMLRSAAAFAGDRTVLYHLIHETGRTAEGKVPEAGTVDRPESRRDTGAVVTAETPQTPMDTDAVVTAETPEIQTDATKAETPETPEIPADEISGESAGIPGMAPAYSMEDMPEEVSSSIEEYTFTGWFDHIGESPPAESVPHKGKNDLIDKFLEESPKIKPDPEKGEDVTDRSEPFAKAGDNLMTETLARIYAKQGLYKKAIYAYEKLSLKYPEKSAYFATQINRIKSHLEENG